MFSNFISIRELIDQYKDSDNANSQLIVQALEAVQEFLLSTSPDLQSKTDQFYSDDDIRNILDNAANGLEKIHKEAEQNKRVAKAFFSCKDTMLKRINHELNKESKIAVYYNTHENSLKTLLATAQIEQNKSKRK